MPTDTGLKESEEATYKDTQPSLKWKDLLKVSTAGSLEISFFSTFDNLSRITNEEIMYLLVIIWLT